MRSILTCSTGLLLLAAQTASAGLSANATVTSEYDFRGLSQTARDPALQAGADYAFGDSGFTLSAWASNIDYGEVADGDLEVDVIGSYAHALGEKARWSVGFVWYTYPGSEATATKAKLPDFLEPYVGLDIGSFSLRQRWSDDFAGLGQEAFYTEASYGLALPRNFSLSLHAGYSFGDALESADAEYLDYSAALGYSAGHVNVGLKLVGTDLDNAEADVLNGEDRLVFYVGTTFPWGD